MAVNNTLALTSGALAIGANTLTLNNVISQASGTLTGGGTSSLVIGDNGSSPSTTLPAVSGGLLNLTVNRANGASLGGPVAVSGTLTLTSGALAIGANTLTLNNAISATGGSLTGGASSSLVIGDAGSAPTTTLPAVASGLQSLTLNRASGLTLSSSLEISGSLTLTTGELVTGANQVSLDAGATWGRTTGWVNGTLQMAFNTGNSQSFTFPIGGQTYYRPVALANLNVTRGGTLAAVVTATAGNHPQITGSGINPSHDVTRYWTLTAGGGLAVSSYNATFTFDASDISSGATYGNFVIREYSGGTWYATTTASQNATSTGATGLTAPFGDFIIGDPLASHMIVTLPGQRFTSGSGNSGAASSQTAGTQFSIPALSAVDIFNTVDATYTGLKTISYTGPGASPGGNAPVYTTSLTFSGGQATGVATTLKKAETTTITATDGTLAGAASSSLTVNPALVSPSVSTVSASPASVTADGVTTSAITVTLKDAYGNPVSGKAVSLAKTSGSGSPTITTVQGTTSSSGVATFTVKSTAAATDVFTATDTTDSPNVTVTQTATVTFTPGALDHFGISSISSPQTAGTPITGVTITAQDANGNTVTSFAGQLTYGGTAGVTGNSGVFVAGVLSGTSITPTVAGNNLTVTVQDANGHTGLAIISTINPASFDHYAVTFSAPPFYAGVAFTTYVTAQDAYNNTVTSDATYSSGTVTFSSNKGGNVTFTSPGTVQLSSGVASILTTDSQTDTGVTITASANSKTATSAGINIVTETGAYVTIADGNWSVYTTWASWNGSAWVPLGSSDPTPTTGKVITITNAVTVTAGVTVDQAYVQSAGQINVTAGTTLTVANNGALGMEVDGLLLNSGTVTVSSGASLLVYGTYQHHHTTDKGAIPSATWEAGSTCEIIGYTTDTDPPGGLNQSFQSFIWNCPNQSGNISLGSGFTSANDFTVSSTGSGSIAVLLGANLYVTNATTVASGAALYCGPYVLSGGSFTLDAGGILGIGSTAGITASAAAGNIQTTTRSFDGGGFYLYNGTATQVTGDGLPGRVGYLTIANSAGVTLSADVAVAYGLNLNSGALSIGAHTLTLRNSVTVGAGTLTGGSSSSLYVGDVGNAAATTLPGVSGGLQNLTLDRANGATIGGAVTVSGNLTLTQGTLTDSSSLLTLASGSTIVKATGAISGAPNFNDYVNFTFTAGNQAAEQGIPLSAGAHIGSVNLAFSSGTVTMSYDFTIHGNLTIAAGATGDNAGHILTVLGNLANSGTGTGAGEVLLTGGSAAHVISGNGQLGNIELSDTNGATVSGSPALSGTLTLTSGALTGVGNLTLGNGTTISRATGSLDAAPQFGTSVNVTYVGTSGVTVGPELPGSSSVLNNLTLSYSSPATLTLGAGCTVNGTLTIGANSTLADGGHTLTVLGDVYNYGVHSGAGEILLNNPSSQTLYGTGIYGNLAQYQGEADLAGSPTINGTLTLPASGSFVVGANTLTLNGPTIGGTPANLVTTLSSSLVFGGSSAGVQIPSSVTELNNLTVNNANGVTMNANLAIVGTLTLSGGLLTTGSYLVDVQNTSPNAVTCTSGWVNGIIQKAFATGSGQGFTVPIGDATHYRPIVYSALNITQAGSVRWQEFPGPHPHILSSGLDTTKTWAFYIERTAVGRVEFDSLNSQDFFTSDDVPTGASVSRYVGRAWSADTGTWSDRPVLSRTDWSVTLSGLLRQSSTGVNSVSDFVAGEQLASAYQITANTGTLAPGASDQLTITLVDATGTTVSYTGNKSLTFSGLAATGDGTAQTVTDQSGTAVPLGTATTISFSGGSSSAGGSLVAYKAQTATLNATDGTCSTLNPGGAGASLTIPNVAPVGGTYFLEATAGNNLVVNVSTLAKLDYDANHDLLTITAVGTTSQSGSGTSVALTDGGANITYSPGSYVGADQFTYTINDGQGGTATSTAKVTVRPGVVTCEFNYISPPTNHIVNLRGHGIPLHTYDVQRSPDMQTWSTISSSPVPAAANGIILYTDTDAPDPQAYYRFAVHLAQ